MGEEVALEFHKWGSHQRKRWRTNKTDKGCGQYQYGAQVDRTTTRFRKCISSTKFHSKIRQLIYDPHRRTIDLPRHQMDRSYKHNNVDIILKRKGRYGLQLLFSSRMVHFGIICRQNCKSVVNFFISMKWVMMFQVLPSRSHITYIWERGRVWGPRMEFLAKCRVLSMTTSCFSISKFAANPTLTEKSDIDRVQRASVILM